MFSVHGWILHLCLPWNMYIRFDQCKLRWAEEKEFMLALMFVVITWFLKVNLSTSGEIQPCKQFWETGTREDTGKNEKFWEPGEIQGTWRNLGSHWRDTGNQEKSWKPGEIQGTRRNLGSHKRYRESGEIQGIRRDTRNQEVYREPVEIQGTAREKQETRG